MEYQVSSTSMIMMSVALVAGVVIPVVLFLVLHFRMKCKVVPFFVGCATFFLFACVLEQVLHMVVLTLSPTGERMMGNIWLYGLYGALAAGVFEETGRFLAMKYVLKKYHDTDCNALMYGAGHGGFEVLYVLGLGMLSNLVLAFTINSGLLETQLAVLSGETYDQTVAAVEALCTTGAYIFGVGIAERFIAVAFHMAISVVVWLAATRGGKFVLFYPLAIFLHFLFDLVAVIFNSYFGIWVTEFALLVIAALFAFAVRALYRRYCVNGIAGEDAVRMKRRD